MYMRCPARALAGMRAAGPCRRKCYALGGVRPMVSSLRTRGAWVRGSV